MVILTLDVYSKVMCQNNECQLLLDRDVRKAWKSSCLPETVGF